VQVLEGFQQLPDDVLLVDIGENTCTHDCMQVYTCMLLQLMVMMIMMMNDDL